MQVTENFTSHARIVTVRAANEDDLVKLIDLKLNDSYRGSIAGLRGYQFMTSHLRLTKLKLEFLHDGISLPKLQSPKLEDDDGFQLREWEKELIVRQWIDVAPKRVVEFFCFNQSFLFPAQFIYSEKGVINEYNLMRFLDEESIVIDDSFGVKVTGGLKGGEELRVYVAWDEYFSVWSN